jgi:nitric oxide reductase NorD protein
MDVQEYLFGAVAKYLKNRKLNRKEILEKTAFLEALKPKLTVIARALTGNAIEIYPAEREGGYKSDNFFLPQKVSIFPSLTDNQDFLLYRILFLSIQKNLDFNYDPQLTSTDVAEAREKAVSCSSEVLKAMESEFEWGKLKHDYFLSYLNAMSVPENDTSWLYGKWMVNSVEVVEDPLKNVSDKIRHAQKDKIETTLKANPVEEMENLTVDKKQQEDHVVSNYFEQVESAEEFGGGTWRDFDGADEMDDHEEALDELQMKHTVRVDDEVHSVYQADFVENTNISESLELDEKGYHLKYDEWDFSKSQYKPNYCKVYPKLQIKTNSNYYKETITDNASTLTGLRKMLTSVNNKNQVQRRQNQGEEFDLEALIDRYVDVKSGRTPSDNIYLSKRKKEKDLSILFLLDASLSSDSYAAGNRVIDVEKQVSILFGEVLDEFNVDFSINSFHSKTRNYTTYLTLKDFDEEWTIGRNKVGMAEPAGYTRIGPALRHSGALLDQRDSNNKWIILISDGKPNDFDKYEGRYGVNDVKQALRELNQRNINTYALAIESEAKYYLPQMFGSNHYDILTTPVELLQSLAQIYDKIKHQS